VQDRGECSAAYSLGVAFERRDYLAGSCIAQSGRIAFARDEHALVIMRNRGNLGVSAVSATLKLNRSSSGHVDKEERPFAGAPIHTLTIASEIGVVE
jgi:hypothetical protein